MNARAGDHKTRHKMESLSSRKLESTKEHKMSIFEMEHRKIIGYPNKKT